MSPAASAGPALTGIAARHRASMIARPGLARTAAVASIAGAVLAMSGCAPTEEGIVLDGADGQKYVVPANAERPQYDSKEACIEDITAQIAELERQGESIADNPEDLCESAAAYSGGGYTHAWLGPIIFAGSRWNSPNVAGWSTVGSGGFAAPGSRLQGDVVSPAPAGANTGDRTALRGGFGTSGKSGFGSTVGG
ncbi:MULTISPECIES: hypothetical protein [unclassified Microbacterium]|uniref:hypothetical protein n=1 Tax=unclassified Microbacterium TaxID=2609290 RepID=UPI00374627DF